ncbi:hypothetical protein FLONG3_7168 [Fusarium longipes]|uniref:Uncharacterized protein n=1 Tax=Fusarium longipes TaxID=694270 RepID=A0A395SFQ1_9HYPO|nr:hypothetical protein FLONG3_7168 [Fusarium longipes]
MAYASNCNLANYGYDFVVATTQASMNADMKAYISNSPLIFGYYCFLADPVTNDPTVPIALEDLVGKTGGVNPFNIPAGTPPTDSRVQALTNLRFAVGIKICVGLPDDIPPMDLPEILELGDSVDQVTFRIFCTQSVVIQNTKPGGWSNNGKWDVWSQPANQLWAFKTSVKLVSATIDNQLNSNNVNLSPSQKQKVLNQLQNISDTAFTLQQLFLDVENADVLNAPTIEGMTAGPAQRVLSGETQSFWPLFSKQCTYPALAIIAQPQTTTDPSQLHLSSYQQVANPFKGSNGGQILSPTKEQAGVATLDYLCMTNGKQAPVAEAFTWNWVQPSDTASESGVMAINQQVFSQYLMKAILPHATRWCCTADPVVGSRYIWADDMWYNLSMTITPNQTPQIVSTSSNGSTLLSIQYTSEKDPDTVSIHGSISGSSACKLVVVPSYQCIVSSNKNQITIQQTVRVDATLEVTGARCFVLSTDTADYSGSCSPYNITYTQIFDVSVDQNGGLQLSLNTHTNKDNSDSDFNGLDPQKFFQTAYLARGLWLQFEGPPPIKLDGFGLKSIQNLVFPGGKVFAYKDVSFSQNGDLLCTLTYLDPEEAVPSSVVSQVQSAEVISAIQTVREVPTVFAVPSVTMTPSSDMIQSYVLGDIFSHSGKFEALQTDDGHSILFGLSDDNVLQAIVEQSGANSTGWEQMDITSTAVASNFASDPNAVVKTFDADQSAVDNTISLAAVVTSGGKDNLMLSLGNPNSISSWTTTTNLAWKSVPFDAVSDGKDATSITIVGVMFAEAITNIAQYTIVDIDRSSDSIKKDIVRYFVDPAASGPCWTKHDIPVDTEAGSYQSCVGRFSKGSFGTDAIFTSGMSDGSPKLDYVPLINPYGDGPPLVRKLSLPGGVLATAIATSRASDGSTDLFAVGGPTLYMFPSDSTASDNVATTLISNSLLQGTEELKAMTHDGTTTVWGRNSDNHVYYVSCPNEQLSTAAAWSTPLPLVTNIDNISAFINRSGGSNTIFAAGGSTLRRLVQATGTGAKLWREEPILLKPQQIAKPPLAFNSYTTTIQIFDQNSLPVSGEALSITAPSRTPVYISGVYHVLSTTPTIVNTDNTGIVTIVESAHKSINGTTLTVTCAGVSSTIDPTEKHFQKISALNTSDSLKAATYPTNVKAGGTTGPSTTASLVNTSTSSNDLEIAATTLTNLNNVYGNVKSGASSSPSPTPAPAPSSLPEGASTSLFGDIESGIEAVAGDVYHALKSAADSVVNIVKDAAKGVWHFVANIAGKIYHAALDTVEAIVGAVEWVFNAIKTVIDDIIAFLEFLLEWDDITRTKDVIHNLTQRCLQGQIDLLPAAKAALDSQISTLESQVNAWAGDPSWMTQIGQATKQPISANTSNLISRQTSGSQALANHYKNNASSLAVIGPPPTDDSIQQLFDDLITALENQGKTLTIAYSATVQLSKSFASQPLEDSLKQFVGIIADVMLSTFDKIGDAILDVLTSLAKSSMSILNTNIHIPVVSDILHDLGVPPLSFLDLFCWIPAVAYTMGYKIATGDAPFPDTDDVNLLKNAPSWAEVQALLGVHSASVSLPPPLSQEFRRGLYISLHSIGALSRGIWTFVTLLEVDLPSQSNPFSKPKSTISKICAACDLIAGQAVPQDPIQNKTLKDVSYAQKAVKFVASLVLSRNKKKLEASGSSTVFPEQDGRARGAMIQVIIGYWGVLDTVLHLFELSKESSNSDQSGALLVEINRLLGQVGLVAYCEALNNPETKEEALPVMFVAGFLQAGLDAALCTTV